MHNDLLNEISNMYLKTKATNTKIHKDFAVGTRYIEKTSYNNADIKTTITNIILLTAICLFKTILANKIVLITNITIPM